MASDSSGVVSPLTAAPTALTPSSSTTKMTRTCSLCGINGHNSRTCTDSSGSGTGGAASGGGGVMLFGVNLTDVGAAGGAISSFRKSASMTNLSQLDKQVHDGSADAATGYASDDALHTAGRSQRKRGVPWTEEEHKMFLLGLNTVGKGDWRGISKNFVKSRTPTQVASHAQKYFLRRINHNRRRRRSSLFDITADTVMDSNEEQLQQEQVAPSKPPLVQTTKTSTNFRMNLFQAPPLPTRAGESINSATALLLPPVPVPPSLKMADLNLNESPELISLDNPPLSLSPPTVPARDDQSEGSGRHSTAKSLQSVGLTGSGLTGSGDSMISVA